MKLGFEHLAKYATKFAGSTMATIIAFVIIIAWTLGGFFVSFDTDYQMYINTGTTIITFLMVFLIQRTQNKESFALQMKLNELIAAHQGCSNRLICLEDLSEEEILKLYKRYKKLAELSKVEEGWHNPHSIEEIEDDD
jgi:low affinity Fe/Cu permease